MLNLNLENQEKLLARFLTYVNYDTQSKPSAKTSPSSSGQLKLAKHLVQELLLLGLKDIELSKYGIVTALLPANINIKAPTLGFIAHLDTSPEVSGKNVKPEIITNYRGGDIALGIGDEYISPVHYPFLQNLLGNTLIVTDGTTLLGADNKAGIAEIITALSLLIEQNIPHGDIRIAFTPDEEIGLGMEFFPIEKFPCDWAYTVDGGAVGELQYENFNAATAIITIYGRNIHLGIAKDKLINALTIACEFQQSFPQGETPENTSAREGFFHLMHLTGDVEKVELKYIIRDFDSTNFTKRLQFIENLVEQFNTSKNLEKKITLNITHSYRNMYDVISKVPQSIDLADKAMRKNNITPIHQPIRGGTDGAWLAEKKLACPNIFTGGYNFHSKYELITLEGMVSAVQTITTIAQLATELDE